MRLRPHAVGISPRPQEEKKHFEQHAEFSNTVLLNRKRR